MKELVLLMSLSAVIDYLVVIQQEQKRGGYQCNADVVLKIRLKKEDEKYYPLKIFCYK